MMLLAALTWASVVATTSQALPESPPDLRCHIHGRVIDERGEPIVGARVVAMGQRANPERVALHGLPEQWTDPEVLSDADGTFELHFVPPQAFRFVLMLEHEAYAELGWRWSQIAEGEERSLGDVTLVRPGVVEGHLQSPSGDLLVEQWFVQASFESSLAHHAAISVKRCAIDSATGMFRFDDLPPGRVSLSPLHMSGEIGAHVVVTTSAAAPTQAVLLYEGPDPMRRIRLHVSRRGPAANAIATLEEAALRAVGADGAVFTFTRPSSCIGEYWAMDLPAGAYRVEIDDPRYERWEKMDVHPGATLHATLVGRAKMHATVLGPDGVPLGSYRLTVRQSAPHMFSSVHELQSAATALPPDGVYPGLMEGSYDLRVTAPGLAEHREVIEGITSDGMYELVVWLSPARPVRGRVVHADGRPVTIGTVQLTLGNVPGHDLRDNHSITTYVADERGRREVSIPFRDASARLDSEGNFDLGELAERPAVVRVLLGDWFRHDVRIDLATLDAPLLITLPPLGSIAGEVSFPRRRPRTMHFLRPNQLGTDRFGASIADEARAGAVDAQGRFVLGPLLAGPIELELIEVEGDPRNTTAKSTIERLRVDVAPGAPTSFELDLGEERPTTQVAVSVTLAGEPATTGLNVVQLTPSDRYDAQGRERRATIGRNWTDPCVLESVPVGVYRLTVSHSDLWSYTAPDPVDVAVGAETRVAVDVPVVRRELRVLVAQGTPCVSSEVWIGPTSVDSSSRPSGAVFFTSPEGRVALALPNGRYAIHLGSRVPAGVARPPTAEFDWRLGHGPSDVRLRTQ